MGGISGSSMADCAAIAKTMVPGDGKTRVSASVRLCIDRIGGDPRQHDPAQHGSHHLRRAGLGLGRRPVHSRQIVPGLLMAVALSIVVHIETVRRGLGLDSPRASGAERWRATKVAIRALILPVVIVGGIRAGIFTATEAGAVAALYALLCGLFIYRTATPAKILQAVRESLGETVAVMVIIAASLPSRGSWSPIRCRRKLTASMSFLTSNWLLFMIALNVFLLFVGLAMEMIASMVILVPILVPMLNVAHIDLVHFGVILVGNLCIGALTPPLGILLFTAAKVTNTPIAAVFRACNPFMVGLIIWLFVDLVRAGPSVCFLSSGSVDD